MNIFKEYAAIRYSFLVIHTTLASENPLCFSDNISKEYKSNHDNWW